MDGLAALALYDNVAEKQVQTSLDEVFSLDDINKAMKKVASGRSRGKTIIKIS